MKTKTILIILLSFAALGKINAQEINQDAVLRYQMAVDEYDNKNYVKALQYIEKADKIDPNIRKKSSYLNYKCIEPFLFTDTTTYKNYSDCLNDINYYLENGKDDDKKTELRKTKIKIEDNEDYNMLLAVDKMTLQEAYDYIKNVAIGSNKYINENCNVRVFGTNRKYNVIDNCKSEFIFDRHPIGNLDNDDLVIFEVDFSQCLISENSNLNFTGSKVITAYYDKGKCEKYFDLDLENFKKGVNKMHTISKIFSSEDADNFGMSIFCTKQQGITKKDKAMLMQSFKVIIKACQK